MPFKLVNLKVPMSILICDRLNNVVFLSLNSIAPITTAAFHITKLILEYRDLPDDVLLKLCFKIGNISCIANLSLPLITALYLFIALYFIKKQEEKKLSSKCKSDVSACSFIHTILKKEDETDEVWKKRTISVRLREEEEYELYG